MIDMTYEDLNRTYAGTVLGIRDEDGYIEPFYVGECDEDNLLRGECSGDFIEIDINDSAVVLSFPDSGAYNLDGYRAVYVARRAERQWHRGVRERALSISGDGSYGASLLRAMFNPSYVSFKEAVERSNDSSFKSLAVGRNWRVVKRGDAEHLLIVFRNRIVGEVAGEGLNYHIPNKMYRGLFEEAIKC